MPDSQIRKVVSSNRREGRRSLSAYGPRARGEPAPFEDERGARADARAARPADAFARDEAFSAGVALSLVLPLVRRLRKASRTNPKTGAGLSKGSAGEGAGCMKRKPSVSSLDTVSLDEATVYLEHAGGDELSAANALAWDRNRLDGSHEAPDDAEVHHALFLLCRARGKHAPSFDEMRVELKRRAAA